jgi:hypothetical protein
VGFQIFGAVVVGDLVVIRIFGVFLVELIFGQIGIVLGDRVLAVLRRVIGRRHARENRGADYYQ